MAAVDKDWVKKQLAKGISSEESVLKSEKDHRDRLPRDDMKDVYDSIIRDDERHVDEMKKVAGKYGYEGGGIMESAGGLLAGLKSAAESVATSDPFQTIGDDLMLKSNAVNYDMAWTDIFHQLGDDDSARAMEMATKDDQTHQHMMRELLTNVGLMEAHGEELEEE